jgi:hypothetical protein
VAQVLAANPQTDDPEMTAELNALRGQFIGLMEQLGIDTSRFGRREAAAVPLPQPQIIPQIIPQGQPQIIPQGQPQIIPQGQPPIPPVTKEEKRTIFSNLRDSKFRVPLQNQLPITFAELKKNPELRQRLIDLLNISQNFYDDSGNVTYNMNQITRDNLTESEYANFRGLYGAYLNYWGLNTQGPPTRTRGGRLKKRKTQKRQKKQYKHKYMKGGWVYKGDPRLDSESTVISESRSKSGSKSRSKSKSKSGNKRKSVRKLKNKGHGLITRKRKRNRK